MGGGGQWLRYTINQLCFIGRVLLGLFDLAVVLSNNLKSARISSCYVSRPFELLYMSLVIRQRRV